MITVEHITKKRVRLRSSFCITPDVRIYLTDLAKQFSKIEKLVFYEDEFCFAVFFELDQQISVQNFINKIDKKQLYDAYVNPKVKKRRNYL